MGKRAAAQLDERLETVCAHLVDAAIDIRLKTGIGEPEFTTALARALLYRIAIVAPPGHAEAMLDSVVEYMHDNLILTLEHIAQSRRETRDKLARPLKR